MKIISTIQKYLCLILMGYWFNIVFFMNADVIKIDAWFTFIFILAIGILSIILDNKMR
jgi:hypothetical protein